MYNRELVFTILSQILEASERINRRFSAIQLPDDFLKSDDGIDRLDAICMMLIAIGELKVSRVYLITNFKINCSFKKVYFLNIQHHPARLFRA